MRRIAGLAEIAGETDAVLLDQFGVLHDGHRLYPHVIETLRALVEHRIPAVVISNSGKTAKDNAGRLARLGIVPELLAGVVTSGQVAREGILCGRFGPSFRTGASVFVIGRRGDDYSLGPLDLKLTDAAEAADFILIAGSNAPEISLEDYAATLAAAARKAVPALCINPDREMLTPAGLAPAPGAIAERYEALGGPVEWIGKPHPAIYSFALELLGNPPLRRVHAIGDSIEHDIVGGARAGLRTVLVRTGISAGLDDAMLTRLIGRAGVKPDAVLGAFIWSSES